VADDEDTYYVFSFSLIIFLRFCGFRLFHANFRRALIHEPLFVKNLRKTGIVLCRIEENLVDVGAVAGPV